MTNEPLLHQLTVGQLRLILEGAQEQSVVVLRLSAGYQAHPDFDLFVNLEAKVSGPIVILTPQLDKLSD